MIDSCSMTLTSPIATAEEEKASQGGQQQSMHSCQCVLRLSIIRGWAKQFREESGRRKRGQRVFWREIQDNGRSRRTEGRKEGYFRISDKWGKARDDQEGNGGKADAGHWNSLEAKAGAKQRQKRKNGTLD